LGDGVPKLALGTPPGGPRVRPVTGTHRPLLLGPFSPVWWVCQSGQGRFLPLLGLFCQKMSKMGP
jgi:hypothetical protein